MTISEYTDDRILRIFALCARLAGPVVAAIGAVIVYGHLSDNSALQFATGGVGVSFVLAGLSLRLLLITRAQKLCRTTGYVLAAAACALALLNIGRYFFGLELANTLAEQSFGDFELARLISMAPSDAIGISLLSVALLLLHVRIGKARPAELLTFGATLISVMTLLGVMLKIDTFCVFMSCARISPVGGLTFTLLCLGALCSCPTEGLMSLMVSKNAGGIMARRLIPAALGIPVFFSWMRMQMQSSGVPDDISLAAMISAMVMVFSLILWWNAWSLEQIDAARQRATSRLRQSEKRTRTIIQQAIDAFIAIDAEGTVKDWNERAEFTFGFMKDEVLGRSILKSVIPERLHQDAQSGLARMLFQGETTTPNKPFESVVQHKDGHEFPVEISLFPVTVDGQSLLCGFVRDITERKQVEQRFKEFYSTVSHELRSPLTSIRGSINVVKQLAVEHLPDTATGMLDIADGSLDRLIRLINDLLDVKRIEEGHLNLELQPLDPIKIAKLAVDGMQGMASKSQVELMLAMDNLAIFTGDADRVVQVLTNLISNAIKFAPKGTRVIVRTARSRNQQRLRFAVEDQGPGIPSADVHKLFSKFGQLSDGRKQLGTGLGLAISKAIVEEHNGEIGLDSSIGKGTTFWFELPLSTDICAIKSEQMTTMTFASVEVDEEDQARALEGSSVTQPKGE
jgi:PAS domain S-box-containing protein